jgi:N-acetylneuraminic acid mutarotase
MMKLIWILILSLLLSLNLKSQPGFTWTVLSDMPEAVSNNAVCSAKVGDTTYVYSFCGIDSTKIHSGIHLNSWRYNAEADRWDSIAVVPDTMGKIGVAASFVNGKIYVTGGYHVLSNGNEITSDKVHVFNPTTNAWESDATPLLYPIDDHVQVVYKDSLIYCITGWSNSASFPYVQIYNTYTNSWMAGTFTPNTGIYKCFGASGSVIGDTLYYYGGTSGSFSFIAQPFLRKGIIDPSNPSLITWSQLSGSPNDAGYRCAPFFWEDQLFWIGGSGISYNYDGIAYDGSGGVDPLARILQYDATGNNWTEHSPSPYSVMDLRGSGKISEGKVIICGGMTNNQTVDNKTYLIEFSPALLSSENNTGEFINLVYPNPFTNELVVNYTKPFSYEIYSITGELIISGKSSNNKINLSNLQKGVFIFKPDFTNSSSFFKIYKM